MCFGYTVVRDREGAQMGMPSDWLHVHARSSYERYGRDVDRESSAPRLQVCAG